MQMKTIGIDLAALEKNASGLAVFEDFKVETNIIFKNSDIIEKVVLERPEIVAIDAPLSFPKSMTGFRSCEKKIIKMGFSLYPPTFKHMQTLTMRGMGLAAIFKERGFGVIEVHPKTSMKILNIYSIEDLKRLGIRLEKEDISEHELDAVVAAYTGFLNLNKKTRTIENEGSIVIPKMARK